MFRMLLVSESFCLPSQPRDIPNQSTADREREGSNCLKIINYFPFLLHHRPTLSYVSSPHLQCSFASPKVRMVVLTCTRAFGLIAQACHVQKSPYNNDRKPCKTHFNACNFSMAMQTPCMEDGTFQRNSQRFPDYL
jgi:hypothetical protein